jgi:spore coat protein CotH
MAVQTALLHQDRCAKNYYVYKSRWSDKWFRIPWDMEDSFATDYRNRAGEFFFTSA